MAALTDFVKEISGEDHLRVEQDFGDGYVRLHVTEAQRRQAAQDIHCTENILLELLRNSKDAHATHIFVALSKEGSLRTITVVDDGEGVPASMHARIFEPRVTSKLETSHKDAWGFHGRGMALYSIRENALSAHIVSSEVGLGTSLQVISDTRMLPERTDQSTFPQFQLSAPHKVDVRGPRNLLRTACEFALEVRQSCAIFVGSPSEIAATLYAFGVAHLSAIDRAFCQDSQELPLSKRLASAGDPAQLAQLSSDMGLNMSQRTARRILNGEIEPVSSLLERIDLQDQPATNGRLPVTKPQGCKLQLHKDEKAALAHAVAASFQPIAASYYLEPNIEPHIKVSTHTLSIMIPLVPIESNARNEYNEAST